MVQPFLNNFADMRFQQMAHKIFGTDGVRGKANVFPMTPDGVMRLATAAGVHFRRGSHRHRVVIGKDTRLSGYMLEPALTAGFVSAGFDVTLLGPIPTPAVGMLTQSLRADVGVMISASHNPHEDNGLKFFGPKGLKLSDEDQKAIEALALQDKIEGLVPPSSLGRAMRLEDAPGRYIEFAKRTVSKGTRLDNLKIVIDCAHGAAYKIAPTILWELGAEIIPIGDTPNGLNINSGCGATSPSKMAAAVTEHKADIGISLDGDADRVVMADETGTLINGDQLMALIAKTWSRENRLKGNGVVGTVMANLGFEQYLEKLGLRFIRTPVGDRHVATAMRRGGFNLGGEQSGHIILNDYATTGDGLVAALQVLSAIVKADQKVSEICHLFDPVPQVLLNTKINTPLVLEDGDFQKAIKQVEDHLGSEGRVLVRKSGTEPVLRVMVEGPDAREIHSLAEDLVASAQAVT